MNNKYHTNKQTKRCHQYHYVWQRFLKKSVYVEIIYVRNIMFLFSLQFTGCLGLLFKLAINVSGGGDVTCENQQFSLSGEEARPFMLASMYHLDTLEFLYSTFQDKVWLPLYLWHSSILPSLILDENLHDLAMFAHLNQ
jgi:hypothetical protein